MFASTRVGYGASIALLGGTLALASACCSTTAQAQASLRQCTALLQKITAALGARDSKQVILLERQNLNWCRAFFDEETYEQHLDTLASALIDEHQFADAIDVANECLQSTPRSLSCLARKTEALLGTNNIREAKTNTPIGVSGDVACDGKGSVGLSITINGEITAKTAQDVEKLFKAYHAAGEGNQNSCTRNTSSDKSDLSPYGTHFSISSKGGDVIAAMTIGRLFRKERAWLGVDEYCLSSCVLILAGAVDRHVARDNIVGIHRPYFAGRTLPSDTTAAAYSNLLTEIKLYLKEMNVSTRLATEMLATEPEAVRMLSLSELRSYYFLGPTPAEQHRRAIDREIGDLKRAERLGIDRLEYNKRRARANAECSTASRSYSDCYTRIMEGRAN